MNKTKNSNTNCHGLLNVKNTELELKFYLYIRVGCEQKKKKLVELHILKK